ncbi:MAG TPA: tetratricopeptide repeat protein [Candidatus Paceibacterota bacterium]|nr:tetratricopeptide repeat protein [Verrucomicrobiota bacterium]HRY50339.1 tetratricopeptide repeat protein [Candidatus Paceibacterota bacterium]
MQDEQLPQEQSGFVQTCLPWLIAGAALVVYLVTLNHWVTLSSLPVVSKATGVDWWTLNLQGPLAYLLFLPFKFLSPAWQVLALNIFSALCAAGTVGLLARSVALLPHDRTRDQRQREPSEYSCLTISSAWLPPVLAALVCGLQLSFWEHATAATGESLNLLLFAFIIRCLLEHRQDEWNGWLYQMALAYGLAVTNNYAMIAFFPLFLAALFWIKGVSLFDFRLLATLAALGVIGLLPYFVLPTVEWIQNQGHYSFWQLMKTQLGHQKFMLAIFPKYIVILCGLTSILPVAFMGIRWPSSLGDTSIIGSIMSQFMFRVVHLLFLVACLWVAFDPPFSPRQLGYGLPFLPFYYLGALSVGYFSGYFLLIGTPERGRHRRHGSPIGTLLERLLMGAVWLSIIIVPAVLVYRNLPEIRSNSGQTLARLSQHIIASMGDRPGLVLSDEPMTLLLFELGIAQSPNRAQFIGVDTRSLSNPIYLKRMRERHGERWPDFRDPKNPGQEMDLISCVKILTLLARSNQVYYLHPSASFYAEGFYRHPQGLIYRMQAYAPNEIYPPPLSENDLGAARKFWNEYKPELDRFPRPTRDKDRATGLTDARFVANFYSRALNAWAVELQKVGQWEEAKPWLDMAAELNPENAAAVINALYNVQRRQSQVSQVKLDPDTADLMKSRNWAALLREDGPFDEPGFSQKIGEDFMMAPGDTPASLRQAAQSFRRVLELDPGSITASMWLGNVYLKGRRPELSLQLIADIRNKQPPIPLSLDQQSEIMRLEAWALFAQTNLSAAEKVLLEAQEKFPGDPTIPETVFQISLLTKRFTNALEAVERQLKIDPHNVKALLNKGALCIQLQNYAGAVPPLNVVLQKEPQNEAALMNRAIAQLQLDKLDEAEKDYLALLERLPKLHSAFYGLGEIADRRQERRKAISYFEQFLEFAPAGTIEIEAVRERLKALKSGG